MRSASIPARFINPTRNGMTDNPTIELCNERDKLLEENKQLKDLLIYILGFSTISVTKTEMEKLEEIKEYVRNVNTKRRNSKTL